MPIVVSMLAAVRSLVRSRAVMHLEILALRHQLQVVERSARPALGVHAVGAATVAVTFAVECQRTQEAYAAWQQGVYDALFGAWTAWNDEWTAGQNRSLAVTAAAAEGSGARNAQIVRDEIKRQVITWLLAEAPFFGRP